MLQPDIALPHENCSHGISSDNDGYVSFCYGQCFLSLVDIKPDIIFNFYNTMLGKILTTQKMLDKDLGRMIVVYRTSIVFTKLELHCACLAPLCNYKILFLKIPVISSPVLCLKP